MDYREVHTTVRNYFSSLNIDDYRSLNVTAHADVEDMLKALRPVLIYRKQLAANLIEMETEETTYNVIEMLAHTELLIHQITGVKILNQNK